MVEMIHDLRKLIEILVAAIKTVKIGRVFQTKGLAQNWRSNNFEKKIMNLSTISFQRMFCT